MDFKFLKMTPLKKLKKIALFVSLQTFFFFLGRYFGASNLSLTPNMLKDAQKKDKLFIYDRLMPMIFIGGDGSQLLKSILNNHPNISCAENDLILKIIEKIKMFTKNKQENLRLSEGGVSDEVIKSALAAFSLDLIASHARSMNSTAASVWCNHDQDIFHSSKELFSIFPNSQFVMVFRDGRDARAIDTEKAPFMVETMFKKSWKWNEKIKRMTKRCLRLPESTCLLVSYESLIQWPEEEVLRILEFLDLPWENPTMPQMVRFFERMDSLFAENLKINITK